MNSRIEDLASQLNWISLNNPMYADLFFCVCQMNSVMKDAIESLHCQKNEHTNTATVTSVSLDKSWDLPLHINA